MIEFQHKLPAMKIDGVNLNGTYNNRELAFPSVLTTTDPKLGLFMHALRSSIYNDRALVLIDGRILMCDKNWIRDHVHVMKGMRHWEYDLESFLDFIIDTQREDGQFFELIKQVDDRHWAMVNEDCRRMYPEDNLSLVRLENEADVEYLVVEGATCLYRVTGDDEWLLRVLPKLEKGIDYVTSDPKRWDEKHDLVKRPFTIDTWDFTYGVPARNRRIEPDTPMSVMHGDNSGVFQAMNQLAWFNRRLGREEKAKEWENRAQKIKENMFRYLWNGVFFIHQLHLNHGGADDRENVRLSLSNTYDINRGVTDTEQSRRIIGEYMKRRETTSLFAEWFSIDPPYDSFVNYSPGQYVNGAVSPFTAGELAKAAFNNGFEEYGWDIITRFMKLVERDGAPYFLYYPDSLPQPDGGPSAWGAAAFIDAIDSGLAGINDVGVRYDEIYFAPRFVVTYYTELRYVTGYESTKTLVDLRFIITDAGMRYDLYSPAKKITCHVLMPKEKKCREVRIGGRTISHGGSRIGSSEYVDFVLDGIEDGMVSIEIVFG